jgi:hypothetical protein
MSPRLRVLTSGLRKSYQPCHWNRAEPGPPSALDGLDARIGAHILADLEAQPRVLVSFRHAVSGDHHLHRCITGADVAAFRLGDDVIGIGCHF